MPEDQDLQVLGPVVSASGEEQARERLYDEGEEEEHRGMVGEPLVIVRIGVSDPYGPAGLFRRRIGCSGYRVARHEIAVRDAHAPCVERLEDVVGILHRDSE